MLKASIAAITCRRGVNRQSRPASLRAQWRRPSWSIVALKQLAGAIAPSQSSGRPEWTGNSTGWRVASGASPRHYGVSNVDRGHPASGQGVARA